MKTKNIIAIITVIAVMTFIGLGIYNDKVEWETAIASIVPTLTAIYFLNGWNKSEEQVEQLKNKFYDNN